MKYVKYLAVTAAIGFFSFSAFADVALTDKQSTLRAITFDAPVQAPTLTPEQKQALRDANAAKRLAKKNKRHATNLDAPVLAPRLTPAQKQALRDANAAKRLAKKNKVHSHSAPATTFAFHVPGVKATGSVQLVDQSGLKYFINTNITFSTSSSASGAASEASYTVPVMASTSAGGLVTSTLSDMFDGYQAICVSLTNATGPCQTGNANYTMYNQNGPATVDATVPAIPTCTNRQYVFPTKTIPGGLSVSRKVFVPTNDAFIRWMDIFTNTTGAPITFTMVTSNNLGSDSNTIIVTSSNGDAVAQTSDTWVTTFQNYSGSTSSDPRIGHILQGNGVVPTPVSNISFANGDDNPFWAYSITLAAGQTKNILNFATGQPTKAAAAAKAAAIAAFPATASQCLSATELGRVVNFASSADLSVNKTSSAPTVAVGAPFSYTINVSNLGPATATSVSLVDTLPAGVGFVSASGTGWTCGQLAGVVTCTLPTLAVGAANPITINVTAPTSATITSNTATVSSATTDPNPANNSSTAVVTVATSVPVMDAKVLLLLVAALSAIALIALRR